MEGADNGPPGMGGEPLAALGGWDGGGGRGDGGPGAGIRDLDSAETNSASPDTRKPIIACEAFAGLSAEQENPYLSPP